MWMKTYFEVWIVTNLQYGIEQSQGHEFQSPSSLEYFMASFASAEVALSLNCDDQSSLESS